jgi:hypothetical protein
MDTRMVVKFAPNDAGNPPGKLADAGLHLSEGTLDGSELVGFVLRERRDRSGRNASCPARQCNVNGE